MTAVEWLVEELGAYLPNSIKEVQSLIEQAKDIEREQLIDCGNTCALLQHINEDRVSQMSIEEVEKLAEEDSITVGEQYYSEKFKKK